MILVYVSDVEQSLPFYQALGFKLRTLHRRGGWAELLFGNAVLALHATSNLPPANYGRVQLCFEAHEPLEKLEARLHEVGIDAPAGIVDENYGRTLQVLDPDGYLIQVNEHDRTLYSAGGC
jgi:catechol 2,3-dioxygenase-like lactoylglutathione lyase family enzyme